MKFCTCALCYLRTYIIGKAITNADTQFFPNTISLIYTSMHISVCQAIDYIGLIHRLYSFDNGLAMDHVHNINYMDCQRLIRIA